MHPPLWILVIEVKTFRLLLGLPLSLSIRHCLTAYQFLCFLACVCCIFLSVLPACLAVCLYVSVSRSPSVCQSLSTIRFSSSHCSFFFKSAGFVFFQFPGFVFRSPVFFLPVHRIRFSSAQDSLSKHIVFIGHMIL